MAEKSEAKRQVVYSIRQTKGGTVWHRIGAAFTNKDGSLNVVLDSLPLDGKLHIREAKAEAKPPEAVATEAAA
jgi:hypothetical protein